ncbi:S9 family peptidase [Salinibaculum salinum]|uniref:S9 family peptidase n=1 Tax=Salinibaculum salinum TaxID=3131996 RepID=UPI0030EE6EDE
MPLFPASVYDLERYLTVRSAYGASLGPDGQLAFLVDTTGVAQVWELTEPGAWPRQRTFGDEPVSFVSYSPTRSELVFGMDDGGNERLQLHRLDADGTRTNLTAIPDAKHRWGGWSHDGEQFAFASNRRDESVFDVYVQDRDATGDDAELVFEGEGWLTVGGWSPDDSRLLLTKAHSSFDQDLYVLDIESGERTHLTPHDGNVRYHSAQWSPDGDGLYLVTDDGSDTLELVRMDAETGAQSIVRDGGEWNIDGIAVDDDTGLLAYSRNVDGYTQLTLGELTGLTSIDEFSVPDLPGNVAGGVSFGPDGAQLAFSTSGRRDNTNVHVADVETLRSATTVEDAPDAIERWTHASTAGIPPETFVEPELVHYETFDGREIPAFFSVPNDASDGEIRAAASPPRSAAAGDAGLPVVVDIHGGPESQRRPSFSGLVQYFLSRGYAVFEPNVRGSTGYGKAYTHLDDGRKRMDSVKDIEAALDWLETQSVVDPDRIVAKGGSYGGFMVLAALTEFPDRWAAGVDSVGIANFVTFLENTGEWRRELREAEYGSLDGDREFLESISPITNIERIDAPLFVLHGENDPRVPVDEAEQIVERASEQGVPVEKLIFEDEGHGISKLDNRIEAYSRVVDFLDEHV